MASDKIPAGLELEALVAERVMGWTRVQPPKWDYNGPLPDQGEVLVPPDWSSQGFAWPNKGVVPLTFFLDGPHNRWARGMTSAWNLVDVMTRRGWRLTLTFHGPGWRAGFWQCDGDGIKEHGATAADAPVAICFAALKVVGVEWEE